jgi:hypothetical protein
MHETSAIPGSESCASEIHREGNTVKGLKGCLEVKPGSVKSLAGQFDVRNTDFGIFSPNFGSTGARAKSQEGRKRGRGTHIR